MRGYRLPPRCKYLRCLGTLRSVDWYYLTEVSRQQICPILTGKDQNKLSRNVSYYQSTPRNVPDYRRFQHSAFLTLAFGKVKVKCTLVQALRLCTGRTAHRGSRGIALPFHDHGTRRRWGVSVTPQPLFTPGKDPVPIVQEAGWAPGPVWTGPPTGIRSPDCPARSQPLYRLSYPAHLVFGSDRLN